MRNKITALREQLSATMRAQFEKEIQRSLEDINTAIAPYTRFVRAEREHLDGARTDLEQTGLDLNKIKSFGSRNVNA